MLHCQMLTSLNTTFLEMLAVLGIVHFGLQLSEWVCWVAPFSRCGERIEEGVIEKGQQSFVVVVSNSLKERRVNLLPRKASNRFHSPVPVFRSPESEMVMQVESAAVILRRNGKKQTSRSPWDPQEIEDLRIGEAVCFFSCTPVALHDTQSRLL